MNFTPKSNEAPEMIAPQLRPALHVEQRLRLNSIDNDQARLTTTPDASATAPEGSNLGSC